MNFSGRTDNSAEEMSTLFPTSNYNIVSTHLGRLKPVL